MVAATAAVVNLTDLCTDQQTVPCVHNDVL
jgi:hypothetical protein